MSKNSPGRNDPCPCGSGKKYKKCCLGKDDARRASSAPPNQEASAPPHPGGPAFRPYMLARLLDDPRNLQRMSTADRDLVKHLWTPRKIAAETTGAIEARLLRYGVPYTPDALRQLIASQESAWKAAKPWIDSLNKPDRMALDFVGLAVCELWKRLYPDPPSLEMLDDWMQEGYQLSAQGQPEEACAIWILEQALARPVRDAEDFDLQSRLEGLRARLRRETEV